MNSTLETASRTVYTEAQQDANWDALSPEQRTYFNRLAEGDPERTGQAFFEDTVPPVLQDNPDKLEVFLNGGTATGYEWVPTRGAAGGEWVEVERDFADRDWSHDVSRANGGSDSADNGRFEDASTNRSRGATNTTAQEQATADAHAQSDAEFLEEATLAEEAEEAANLALAAEASELLAAAGEVTLDFLAPLVGGAAAAKVAADQFEKTEEKLVFGGLTGVATATVLCTPVGQLALGGYLTYKLGKRAHKFFSKQSQTA